MFSRFFIFRPIFATVLAIIMVLAGFFTMKYLPVAQYPNITPPTVMVSAEYPGADALTVAQAVGIPIEQAVNGVEGMMYMSSSSSDGSYSLTITFESGTDIDEAAVKVQNKVQDASSTLPASVLDEGLTVNTRSSNNVLFVAIESSKPEYDALYLTNYAQLNLIDPLSRVKGVGGVQAFGSGEYSMRIWLDPDALRQHGLTPADVREAIATSNVQVSAGTIGDQPGNNNTPMEYTLTASGMLSEPSEFGNITLRSTQNGFVRLRDVATVELGSNSYGQSARLNGKGVALMGVEQLPGANALDVADGAITELDKLSKYFPEGISYNIVQNSTDYVRESIDNVMSTFVITTLIVMVVILIFLQNWRAVVIPMLTIPVSLIATFVVMKLLGFTLNTLTLFGLVLAIAIVVDDAIVVVEDCSRLVDKGELNRKQAAVKAMKELTGPVVGEVLVLLSVFIPTAFISGITGELYKQFALTIATATAFSGFNALTLTPALCSLFLKPRTETRFFLYRWFNKGWAFVSNLYTKVVGKTLAHPYVSLTVFIVTMLVCAVLFLKRPTSYIPEEDMGYFITSVELPENASEERTDVVASTIAAEIKKLPQVKDVVSIAGFSFMGGSGSNMASTMVMLKPWGERGKNGNINDVIAAADKISARHPEAIVYSLNPPAIPGLGMSSGLEMQLLDINNLGAEHLMEALGEIRKSAQESKEISQVTSMYQGLVPQYKLEVDRDRLAYLGLSPEEVFSAIGDYVGGDYVDNFIIDDRLFQVNVRAKGDARSSAEDVLRLSVANSQGKMVPVSAFATVKEVMGVPSVDRYNMYTTASLTATTAKGVSSSEGIKAMENIVAKAVGDNFSYAWTGIAYQETQAGTTISFVFIFAIIMTLLVLAAQYESWTSPIAVICAMPVAVAGTAIGSLLMNESISIYTQIGLILLLGMAAKNAILIVEYAMDFRKSGKSILQSALDAGSIRFRPIMMTALAFIFGVLPMMFSTGAGANSRIELGTAIVFGMTLNAFFGTLFVPVFWMLLQRFQEKYLSKLFALTSSKISNAQQNAETAGSATATPESTPDAVKSDSI